MSEHDDDSKLVRVYPTADAYIPGVPHVVQDVTPKRAKELLAYSPAAFTNDGWRGANVGDQHPSTTDAPVLGEPGEAEQEV